MTIAMSPFISANGSNGNNGSNGQAHSQPHSSPRLDDAMAVARLEADLAEARRRAAAARQRAEVAEAAGRDAVPARPSLAEIEQQYAGAIQSVRDAARLEAARIIDEAHRTARGVDVV